MKVGDRVKTKVNQAWVEGEIIEMYSYPDEFSIVDILLDDGTFLKGISTREVYGF